MQFTRCDVCTMVVFVVPRGGRHFVLTHHPKWMPDDGCKRISVCPNKCHGSGRPVTKQFSAPLSSIRPKIV